MTPKEYDELVQERERLQNRIDEIDKTLSVYICLTCKYKVCQQEGYSGYGCACTHPEQTDEQKKQFISNYTGCVLHEKKEPQ